MITRKVRRLWNGTASLRDYELEKALKTNQPIRFVLGKDSMTLSPQDLKKKQVCLTSRTFQKKFGVGTYTLVDYEWRPDKCQE